MPRTVGLRTQLGTASANTRPASATGSPAPRRDWTGLSATRIHNPAMTASTATAACCGPTQRRPPAPALP